MATRNPPAVSDVARLPTPRGPTHAAGHARVDPARARALPDVRVLLLEGRQRREVAERARQGLVREALCKQASKSTPRGEAHPHPCMHGIRKEISAESYPSRPFVNREAGVS